ncbi:TerB N-terminal domain-containing protein [Clostridium cellulovorans]|nr:TerB N-terminal domain-containing protein [Clostridium cellulovorans]
MMVHSQSINCKPVGVNTYDGLDIKQDEVKKEEFSDVEIFGEQESRQAIPARPSYEQEGFRISFSVDKQREKFFRDMKKYSSKEGKKVLFVPFMTYWPTYDSMDGQQQAWYFYWRSQVREENYIDTGLSYIFVYIYELLSGIGWTAPQEGLVKLSSIWTRYRERFSKLDRYMPDWIFDFTQLHKLEYMSPVEKDYIHLMPSVVTDILIDRHSEEVPLKLSFSLIETLTDYAIVNSKFYKDGNQELIKEAIPRVIALVDVVLRKKKQKGILAIYGPSRTKKQARYIFSSAVCPQANEEFVIVVKGYSTNSKLRAYINELVRYGENVLRGLRGYRGRLRGITLDEEIAKLIEAFLKKEYGEHPEAKLEELSKKEIVLDFQSIDHLRAQSDAVRIALEVEDSVVTEEKPLLTDVAEVTEIYLALSPTAREILNRLEKSGWESKKLPEDEKAIQEINRLAERYLGCMLIASENENIIVEDDYRDELEYIYGNPPQILEQGNGKELFNVNELPVELKEFVEALMPDQKDVLHVLLTSKNPQSDLERISEKVMMMPEILVDDINALAMQLLGDIIIDTMEVEPVIIQEYLIPLKKSII